MLLNKIKQFLPLAVVKDCAIPPMIGIDKTTLPI